MRERRGEKIESVGVEEREKQRNGEKERVWNNGNRETKKWKERIAKLE